MARFYVKNNTNNTNLILPQPFQGPGLGAFEERAFDVPAADVDSDEIRAIVTAGTIVIRPEQEPGAAGLAVYPEALSGTGHTSDATPLAIAAFTPADNTCAIVNVSVACRSDDGAENAGYMLTAVVERVAGTTALVGAVTALHTGESTAGLNATLAVVSDSLEVQVTGLAATEIDWICTGTSTTARTPA